VAVELIQAASLIHDDIGIRTPSAETFRQSDARGGTTGGLVGDLIFASAIKMMSDSGREDGSIISDAIAQLSRGAIQEFLDPLVLAREIESNRVDGSLYGRINHLKTGYLFGAACRLGAIGACANKSLRARSERYGLRIGEAYQIADDLQEVKRHMKTRFISANQMTLLAPAFLNYVKDVRVHLVAVLRKRPGPLSAELHSVAKLQSGA
jgi:octaprenyl-diphosphate synthase